MKWGCLHVYSDAGALLDGLRDTIAACHCWGGSKYVKTFQQRARWEFSDIEWAFSIMRSRWRDQKQIHILRLPLLRKLSDDNSSSSLIYAGDATN